jgi:hypothetical protein
VTVLACQVNYFAISKDKKCCYTPCFILLGNMNEAQHWDKSFAGLFSIFWLKPVQAISLNFALSKAIHLSNLGDRQIGKKSPASQELSS